MRLTHILMTAVLAAIALTGCGGGGGNSAPSGGGGGGGADQGKVLISVVWPTAPATPAGPGSKVIPLATTSIHVTAKNGATTVVDQTLVKPATSLALTGLPITPLAFKFDALNGSTILATASQQLTPSFPVPAQPTTIALVGTITKITVALNAANAVVAGNPSAVVAQFTPKNAANQVIPVDPSTISWSISTSNPAGAASINATSGAVLGLKVGKVTIVCTYHEPGQPTSSNVVGTLDVDCKSNPNSSGGGLLTYLLGTTLGFGSWGSDYTSANFQLPSALAVRDINGVRYAFVGDIVAVPDNFGGGQQYVGPFHRVSGFQLNNGSVSYIGLISSDSSQGDFFHTFPTYDFPGDGCQTPNALAIDASGNVYVADGTNVREEAPTDLYVYDLVDQTATANPAHPAATVVSSLTNVSGLAIDGAGNVFMAAGTSVVKASAGSFANSTVLSGFSNATGIAITAAGGLVVADSAAGKVYKYAPNGSGGYVIDSTFGTNGSISNVLHPTAVAVFTQDSTKPNYDNIYVADESGDRVAQFNPYGVYLTDLAQNQYTNPSGISLTSDGTLYVVYTGDTVFLNNQFPAKLKIAAFTPQDSGDVTITVNVRKTR